MSKIFGLTTNDIRPQPGFTATQSQEGGWTGTHSFAIRRTAWNSNSIRSQFKIGTAITTLDTDLPTYFEFLKISSVNVISDEGDITIVQVGLGGAGSAQYGADGPDAATYRLTCSLQEAPISDHQKWKLELTDIEKEALGFVITGDLIYDAASSTCGTRDERTYWVESNSEGTPYIIEGATAIEFAKLIASGQTTYLRPTMVWTESVQGNTGLSFDEIEKLGKIDNPRGNPPDPSGVRDWMLTGAFSEQTGGLFRTELEWTMSEAGGFNETLYGE
jgi:hypothetical protein